VSRTSLGATSRRCKKPSNLPFDGCLLSYTLCDAVLVCSFEGQIFWTWTGQSIAVQETKSAVRLGLLQSTAMDSTPAVDIRGTGCVSCVQKKESRGFLAEKALFGLPSRRKKMTVEAGNFSASHSIRLRHR
jgi:hypothetical protein